MAAITHKDLHVGYHVGRSRGGSYLAGNVPGEIAVWRELKLTHILGLVINYLNIPGLVERHRNREREGKKERGQ